METIVIQIGARQGRVMEIAKSDGDNIRIGRGFSNDVVLTDPYIADEQLCFFQKDGEWQVEVLDTTNPVLLNGKPLSKGATVVSEKDKVKIGRTTLRIYSEQHQVDETRKLLLFGWLHQDTVYLVAPVLALLLVSAMDGFIDYIQTATTDEWGEFAAGSMLFAVMLLFWSALWSIIGRLFKHRSNLAMHILSTSIITGTATLLYLVFSYLAYNASSMTLNSVLGYITVFVALAALIKFNLLFATNNKRTTTWGVVVSCVFCLFVYGQEYFNRRDFDSYPKYASELKPPFAHIVGSVSLDDYFTRLKEEVNSIIMED